MVGDAREKLTELPDDSVHCVMTSPPYWHLRKYHGQDGMIGCEPTLKEHLDNLVEVFREVRRVMRPDATLWLNYGDAYANDAKWGGSTGGKHNKRLHGKTGIGRAKRKTGFKPKDLMGLAWRVAFALQDDGWYLRRDIIWHKTNPMPESAKDRPTTAHEYLFLLSKKSRYYYDQEAIKEPVSGTANARTAKHNTAASRKERANPDAKHTATKETRGMRSGPFVAGWANNSPTYSDQDPRYAKRKRAVPPSHEGHEETSHRSLDDPKYDKRRRCTPKDVDGRCARLGRAPGWRREPGVGPKTTEAGSGIKNNESMQAALVDLVETRNCRSVWTFPTAPFLGTHFATFPPALCERPIKAGCPEGGVVLDPFAGVGTVGLVANRLGRDAILVEISPEYAEMARARIIDDAPLFAETAK